MKVDCKIHTTPEDVLLQRVGEQDSDSFSILYERYLPLICKTWYQFHLADLPLEDWKQEAAVVLYRTACSYHNKEARFCWYLRQALRNKIRDLYRQQAAQKRIPTDSVEPITDIHIDQHLMDANLGPDEISHYRLIYGRFIRNCSLMERDAFILINSGEHLDEIAKRLSCSPLSVRSAFERARKKFLKCLAE